MSSRALASPRPFSSWFETLAALVVMTGATWFTRHHVERANDAWSIASMGDVQEPLPLPTPNRGTEPQRQRAPSMRDQPVADAMGALGSCAHAPRVSGGVAAQDPRQSFVLLAATQRLQSLRVGDRLWRGTIASIGWNATLGTYAVVTFTGGSGCLLSQFGNSRDDARPRSTATIDPLDRAVDRLGDNLFRVQRSTLLHVLAQPDDLMRTTRAFPVMVNGRITGVRLASTTPAWMLGRVGFQNGDVLVRVDGHAIESIDQLLEAYARLQSADSVHLGVMRGGAAVQIDYELR